MSTKKDPRDFHARDHTPADIAGGDARALYFAWLLDVQSGEIDDDVVEPARPDGLGSLSPALDSVIDIIGLDRETPGSGGGRSIESAGDTARQRDLREIGERKGRHVEVTERIRALRERHAKKPSFLARLRKAGF